MLDTRLSGLTHLMAMSAANRGHLSSANQHKDLMAPWMPPLDLRPPPPFPLQPLRPLAFLHSPPSSTSLISPNVLNGTNSQQMQLKELIGVMREGCSPTPTEGKKNNRYFTVVNNEVDR